jgi:TP901 family phage tail tape measure protein
VSVVANVAINVDSRNAVSKLRQVQTQSQQTERAVEGLSRAFGGLAAAFGAGFALTKVIADVKELDTNLRRLGTVGGNVAALDKGLGALSDQLDGVANKAELAAASYQALSAGFTETGANLRVVEAATKAAVGGMVDVTAATEVTTKVLNAYNMSGDQATKVTDSIAKSIEYGVVQWSDYTSQLGRVASISAVAGVSLDEINAFIAAATKNSATAEIAFTGLGATLSNMLRPTTESAEAAAALGINWNLAGIRGEGFESLMGKLGIAMQKNPVLANQMVGGQEAVRGAFAAAAKGGKDYAMILEGLGGAAGKTDADFQTMKGSLENTLKALDTSFKNLSEALGTAFGPTVVIAVQDITKAVNGFADFMAMVPQPVMNTVGTIVKLVAQILLVQKAIQSVIALKAGVTGMLGATAASATAAGTAAGGAATKVNMLKGAMLGLLKFALVTIAIDIVVSGLGKLAEVQARMNAITKGSTKQFAEQVGGSATSRTGN